MSDNDLSWYFNVREGQILFCKKNNPKNHSDSTKKLSETDVNQIA